MQKGKIKIFITSCEIAEGAWRTHEKKLKTLYELSNKKYSLTNDPKSADIILVGNAREENWGKKIMNHDLINKYPKKCFSLSDQDSPLILNRGIYASGVKNSILGFGRVRTGSYTIYGDHHLNPFIQNHESSNQSYLEKKYLFTFIGRNSHEIRSSLFNLKFKRPDILIKDSSKTFDLWSRREYRKKVDRQKYYYDMLLRSKFSLCPRGCGASSMRIFESMKLGISPIIVSDNWILPKGPMWDEFSILIKEKNINDLEKIVESRSDSFQEMGQKASSAFEENFSKDVYFNYIIDNCLDIMKKQLIPEVIYWKLNPLIIFYKKIKLLSKY
jgi:hypothetical protein